MSSPPDRSDQRFTDDDARELSRLLAKYATSRLHHFDLWKLEFKWGSVYVDIGRRPFQGASEVAYTRIWPLAPHHPASGGQDSNEDRSDQDRFTARPPPT